MEDGWRAEDAAHLDAPKLHVHSLLQGAVAMSRRAPCIVNLDDATVPRVASLPNSPLHGMHQPAGGPSGPNSALEPSAG